MIWYSKTPKTWKYGLERAYEVYIGIRPHVDFIHPYYSLTTEGVLTLRAGFRWDGPSGPAIDTKSFMRGSAVHDALYQMIRAQKLPLWQKDAADRLLQRMCLEDGMWKVRAEWVYQSLRLFGSRRTQPLPEDNPKILVAP